MIWEIPAEMVPLWGIGIGILAMLYHAARTLWEIKHPTPQAWCQGCDQNQPTPSMRFTEIGLYRCSVCRESPKLLDQAKAIIVPKPVVDHYETVWTCDCENNHQPKQIRQLAPAFRPGAQF